MACKHTCTRLVCIAALIRMACMHVSPHIVSPDIMAGSHTCAWLARIYAHMHDTLHIRAHGICNTHGAFHMRMACMHAELSQEHSQAKHWQGLTKGSAREVESFTFLFFGFAGR